MDGLDSLRAENDALRADLAQMKSTLSDTQQKLRAVQEDRDEFAAKMNDAVERAEALQGELSSMERRLEEYQNQNDKLCDKLNVCTGQIEAFRFVIEHWRGGGTS